MVPKHGDVVVHAILIYALNELKDLINVGKNLTNPQISFIASRLIEKYGYWKIEEIKYVLYRAVEREKLFDRLDPNIVLGWFADYDDERTEEAMRISDQEEAQQANQITERPDAVSFEGYVESLRCKAENGDKDAKERLDEIENPPLIRMRLLTAEEKHQKELEFFKFKTEYKRKN